MDHIDAKIEQFLKEMNSLKSENATFKLAEQTHKRNLNSVTEQLDELKSKHSSLKDKLDQTV
jgi:chromosome segregation ATPase